MDKFLKCLHQFLYPHILIIILCSCISFPFMILSLMNPEMNPILMYGSFTLSGYSFLVICVGLPKAVATIKHSIYGDDIKIMIGIRKLLLSHRFTCKYIKEPDFRARIALYTGLFINSLFGAFKCATGVYYDSAWLLAIGIYYFALGAIRFMLLFSVKKVEKEENSSVRKGREWNGYRRCGIMLLIMYVTMVGMMIQMVWQNKSNVYPGWTIYISALYTFYYFITALISMIRFIGFQNPIYSAAKNVTLAGAAMSVLMLQTAMLSTFGNGYENEKTMNGITGAVVSVFCVGMAVFMIAWANRKIGCLEK